MKKIFLAFIGILALAGCENSPMSKLVDPTVSNHSGQWSDIYVLYDDELRTDGITQFYTTADGQVIRFQLQS